jgi:hypothetical protein
MVEQPNCNYQRDKDVHKVLWDSIINVQTASSRRAAKLNANDFISKKVSTVFLWLLITSFLSEYYNPFDP